MKETIMSLFLNLLSDFMIAYDLYALLTFNRHSWDFQISRRSLITPFCNFLITFVYTFLQVNSHQNLHLFALVMNETAIFSTLRFVSDLTKLYIALYWCFL